MRLIIDQSQLKGQSVNDGNEHERCLLRYTSVDEAIRLVLAVGPGAKLDLTSSASLVSFRSIKRIDI